jgi:hypothetical protein
MRPIGQRSNAAAPSAGVNRFHVVTGRALSRRAVLRGTGVALALPLLDCMQPAFATAAAPPMRFVGVLNYLSFHTPYLFPREAGAGYTPSRYLESLRDRLDDITVISGLNHPGVRDGHASDKSFFTGAPAPGSALFRNTVSLDQLAAERIGHATRHASLTLSTSANHSCSWTKSGVPVPPENSPARGFARLFIDGTPAERAAEVARLREGRSILDRVAGEAKRLERNVAAGDREKLEQYLAGVRNLETNLVRQEDYASRAKPDPHVPPIQDVDRKEDTARFKLLLDVARLALETDLTRIVTVYFVGTSKTPSLPNATLNHHFLSHHGQDPEKLEHLATVERDALVAWGGFLSGLAQARDGDGRLLDHTISVVGAGMGNASSHDSTNVPLLVAGGRFAHGTHIAHDPANPPPLCNLWVQILGELGVPVDRFGSSNATTLSGLMIA